MNVLGLGSALVAAVPGLIDQRGDVAFDDRCTHKEGLGGRYISATLGSAHDAHLKAVIQGCQCSLEKTTEQLSEDEAKDLVGARRRVESVTSAGTRSLNES